MSQENQGTNSSAMDNTPMKRKRGRPRKDENMVRGEPASSSPSVTDIVRRNRRRRADEISDAMVGQVVSGVLEGSFDAGYLLTVKVGNTNSVLRGVVFEPGLSVPISASNDVAPHVKMFKRSEIPLPTQLRGTNLQSELNNERPVKVSVNEGAVVSKFSPPIKHVPRASQLSTSQVQDNPTAFSKGEVHGARNFAKSAPSALLPEESKGKLSPSLPVKGLAGEASSDAGHADQVSLQQLATSQTENTMLTDVMRIDKSGHPTGDAPHALPPEESEAVLPSLLAKGLAGKASSDASHADQVSSQLATSQTENTMPTDVMQIDKSVHPMGDATHALPQEEKEANVLPSLLAKGLAGKASSDANHADLVSLQLAVSQTEDRMPADVMEISNSGICTRGAPDALLQEDCKAKTSPSPPAEGLASEASGDTNHAVRVPSEEAVCQAENGMATDVLHNDESGPFAGEAEELPVGAGQVLQVSMQSAAPQVEKRESIELFSNDKSDPPSRELEGLPGDSDQMLQVPSQAEAMKPDYVLPNDNLLPREPEAALNDAIQVNENFLQGAGPERESIASADVLPVDKTNLLTTDLHSSNQASLIKSEQVEQPVVECELSAIQPLQLEHDRSVAPAEKFQEIEAPTLIEQQPFKSSGAPENSDYIPSTELSLEKLPSSGSVDQVTQVPTHALISELQPGWHADETLTSRGSEFELNCIPVSDSLQPAGAQPDNEMTDLVEKKASPEGDTPQDFKLSDEIPSKDNLSHLDGCSKADVFEMTEGHKGCESQTCQPVDVFHSGAYSPIFDSSVSTQNEAAIPCEQQKGTTSAVSLDLELSGHQILTSTLPIQSENTVAEDAIPSAQSECDPVELKVTDCTSA